VVAPQPAQADQSRNTQPIELTLNIRNLVERAVDVPADADLCRPAWKHRFRIEEKIGVGNQLHADAHERFLLILRGRLFRPAGPELTPRSEARR
jgi:hypothetical protein